MEPKLPSLSRTGPVRHTDLHAATEPFGKYRLISPLSKGGMAELFIALQEGVEGFSKVVVVKRTLPHLAENPEFTSMFLNEARLASRLDHPCVVHINDLGQIDSQFFMAMEYLPGEDLAQIIRQTRKLGQRIDPDIAATMVQAVAEGLQYAHELTDEAGRLVGLVHRDINPSNVILTYHGNVKLVDFGIAKAVSQAQMFSGGESTRAGVLKGKIAYLSPEQASGEPVDRRSDVFCMGIMLWELLVGRKLFARDNEVSTLRAILNVDVPSLGQFASGNERELEMIAHKALARHPKDRFQTAGEMYDALEEYFEMRMIRPSSKHLTQWLMRLFGERRAAAKLQIAKGSNLKTALQVLRPTGAGPSLTDTPQWPSGPEGTFAIAEYLGDGSGEDDGASSRLPRRKVMAAFLGLSALAIGIGLFASNATSSLTDPPKSAPARTSQTIESVPSGAMVFIDGEPIGRRTPTTLKGLVTPRMVQVRLEMQGYLPARGEIALEGAALVVKNYRLEPSVGRLTFRKIPKGSQVILDGEVRSSEVVELTPGQHHLQLLSNGQTIYSRTLEVRPGEQIHSFAD
jgi:eukaryotic-like serine/threonine-protein kinase